MLALQLRPCSYWPEQLLSLWCDLSFQEHVIQIKLHQIRRIYKRRHGLRPLVRTLSSSTLKIVTSLQSVTTVSNVLCCVHVSPHPGSRGVLHWEWFLLWYLPEVLQHSRQRWDLLLHRHFLGWEEFLNNLVSEVSKMKYFGHKAAALFFSLVCRLKYRHSLFTVFQNGQNPCIVCLITSQL